MNSDVGGVVISYADMIVGFEHAVHRHRIAVEARNSVSAFLAVFEALNWATSIDERLKSWSPDGEPLGWARRGRIEQAEILRGIRFARNRAHHQWANVLVLPTAEAFPIWTWRDADELPAGDQNDHGGETIYRHQLAGMSVQPDLDVLWLVFRTVQAVTPTFLAS